MHPSGTTAFGMAAQAVDGQELKLLFHAGLDCVSQNVDAINRMNVFPVPDGDTGVNMHHTLQRAYTEIKAVTSRDVSLIADRFAYGALMGARGNSGAILSQLLKGFAQGLNHAQTLTPLHLLAGCQMAVKLAYQSVRQPVEGTILTVARESTEALQNCAAPDMTLYDMLKVLTQTAEQSLHNTPNLLPILKEVNAVDSGGMGLFLFLQGMTNCLAGDSMNARTSHSRRQTMRGHRETALASKHQEHYGYDVQFLMLGQDMDVAVIRQDFEKLGWSVVVVGDESTVRVHIHVDNPAIPLNYAVQTGAELDDIVVENMQRQYQEYVQRPQPAPTAPDAMPTQKTAVITVAAGDGIRAVFKDLNCAWVIEGGQSMNPDVEDFLKVIDSLPSEQVIILPNNRNVMMTARQAAQLVPNKDVRMIPTATVLQGISAMIACGDAADDDADLDAMIARMTDACSMVCSIEITTATHSAKLRGIKIRQGEYIGLVDGEIRAAAATIEDALSDVFSHLDAEEWELATVYYGEHISESNANRLIERLSNAQKGLEFEAVYGGQTLYPYLISVE